MIPLLFREARLPGRGAHRTRWFGSSLRFELVFIPLLFKEARLPGGQDCPEGGLVSKSFYKTTPDLCPNSK